MENGEVSATKNKVLGVSFEENSCDRDERRETDTQFVEMDIDEVRSAGEDVLENDNGDISHRLSANFNKDCVLLERFSRNAEDLNLNLGTEKNSEIYRLGVTETETTAMESLAQQYDDDEEESLFNEEAGLAGELETQIFGIVEDEEQKTEDIKVYRINDEVAGMVFDQVEGDEIMDSQFVTKNLKESTTVTGDSFYVSELTVRDALQDIDVCSSSEYKLQEDGKVLMVESYMGVNESSAEQIQDVCGEEVAVADNKEVESISAQVTESGVEVLKIGSPTVNLESFVGQMGPENTNDKTFVTIHSSLHAEVDDDKRCDCVKLTVFQGIKGESSENEGMRAITKIANEGLATMMTELVVKNMQVLPEEEVAEIEEKNISKAKDESVARGLDANPGDEIPRVKDEGESIGSTPNGHLSCKEGTSAHGKDQEMIVQVVKSSFHEVLEDDIMDSLPVNENLKNSEPESAHSIHSVGPFTNVFENLEFQLAEGCSSSRDEDQTTEAHMWEITTHGEISQTVEAKDETEAAGEFSELYANHSVGSDISGVAVSLNIGLDEAIREDVSPPDESHDIEIEAKRMSTDMGLDENSTKLQELNPDFYSEMEHGAHENGEYSLSDLVWGKVRSHPWWPGQIFDSSDSSERALKYRKKDSFLVAYFGDQSFAWNETSSLKPFQPHFLEMDAQTSTETLHRAVDCALDEIVRRVDLGMACSCTPKELYDKVEYQIIDNAGIRQESRIIEGIDRSLSVFSFKPDNLVDYMKALALNPCGKSDRVELVIAQAQLTAFYRLKGYPELPKFHVYRGLWDTDADVSFYGEKVENTTPVFDFEEDMPFGNAELKIQGSSSRKRKYELEDALYPNRKERSLLELMNGDEASSDLLNGGADEIAASKSSTAHGRKQMIDMEASTPQSFKIGECISRIASRLTGTPPILKCSTERFQKSAFEVDVIDEGPDGDDGFPYTLEKPLRRRVITPNKYSSDEMLSEFTLTVRDSMKGSKENDSRPVTEDTKKRSLRDDDDDDDYTPKKEKRKYRRRTVKSQLQLEKPVSALKETSHMDEFTPTALILTFAEADSVPSKTNLNKIFNRFGPLRESETEVSMESSCATVVFKKRIDGEVAFSSAQKFSIFGQAIVTYQLKYLPLTPTTPLLCASTQSTTDATHIEGNTT
ncbi:hypothetical protein GIB67_030348 [Kingdonia uniflora]|uniref:PWWP domain-containing protein n=1 Tax=Kingdonia uniflora TaxID=39325 RepID=A0A7J7M6P5_9MAGN|nr:hypothetical protein GIB67_030348 [Kingdonia uniflora]